MKTYNEWLADKITKQHHDDIIHMTLPLFISHEKYLEEMLLYTVKKVEELEKRVQELESLQPSE